MPQSRVIDQRIVTIFPRNGNTNRAFSYSGWKKRENEKANGHVLQLAIRV